MPSFDWRKVRKFLAEYLWSLADLASTAFNNVFFFARNANQPFSTRCFLDSHLAGFAFMEWVIDGFFETFFGEKDHCLNSALKDVQRGKELEARVQEVLARRQGR